MRQTDELVKRRLRPQRVFPTVDAVWVPDETQPVAAILDPCAGSLRGLVSWADLPFGPVGDSRGRCTAGGETFWVQQGDHLLAMKPSGVRWSLECPGLTLMTAGPTGAWLADLPRADSGLLYFVPGKEPTGGLPRPITLDRRIRGVHARADGLEVTVLPSPSSRPAARADRTARVPPSGPVRTHLLTWAALAEPRLTMAEHPTVTATSNPDRLPWLPEEGARWQVGGQEWHLGWGPTQRGEANRDVVATAADGTRVHLGSGTAVTVTAGFDRLWLTLSRRRRGLYVDRDAPHEVKVLDPETGQVRTVLDGTGGHEGTVPIPEISAHCWKVPDSPPPGAREHEERWRLRFADLEHFWHSNETGAVTPLVPGMHDAHATLHGSWPGRTLQLSFVHPRYPDGVMRRTLSLYDELGRPLDLEYADTLLMEDLGVNHIPTVDDARNGILDI